MRADALLLPKNI